MVFIDVSNISSTWDKKTNFFESKNWFKKKKRKERKEKII